MLNRLASLAMSTSVLKALPGKLDIKIHSPSILYVAAREEATQKYHVSQVSEYLGFMVVSIKITCYQGEIRKRILT